MSGSRCLIVNADDFGASPAVNAGVVEAHERGIVTSASLMATGAAFDEAVAASRAHPRLGVGVHLAWVGVHPISPPAQVRTLVGQDGRLAGGWMAFCWRWATRQVDYDEVEREGAAQIERVLATGIRPDHLNGEQHLHMLPGMFERVVRLAHRYHIPAIRVTWEPALDWWGDLRRWPGLVRRRMLHWAAAAAGRAEAEFWRPVACFGLADSCQLEESRLLRFIQGAGEGVSEVMCHPSRANGEPGDRPRELAALTSPDVREAIAMRGITLTTFGEAAK
jgi:predicted glycoside hydrolase/deacetylase ChbG (UPF0249 family)